MGRLKRGEDSYYQLIDATPLPAQHAYDKWLYYFAVSISWRCALCYFEDNKRERHIKWAGHGLHINHAGDERHMKQAMDAWKKYLHKESPEPEPFSQYLVSIASQKWTPWNRSLGGFAMPNLNLVFSIVGPMVVLGLSQPDKFDNSDRFLLKSAQLRPSGGQIILSDETINSLTGVGSVKTAIGYWKITATDALGRL